MNQVSFIDDYSGLLEKSRIWSCDLSPIGIAGLAELELHKDDPIISEFDLV
jgi:hypothetical protein